MLRKLCREKRGDGSASSLTEASPYHGIAEPCRVEINSKARRNNRGTYTDPRTEYKSGSSLLYRQRKIDQDKHVIALSNLKLKHFRLPGAIKTATKLLFKSGVECHIALKR